MKYIIIATAFLLLTFACKTEEKEMKYKELTSEEKRVIINKGTEMPYSGEYYRHFEKGVYACKQCGSHLYHSSSKFDAHCGWPSFDDEIPNAVKRLPDADGMRTEIICANCSGHLGHVFIGERLTSKNTRHCVNSISLVFIPDTSQYETAIFAAGCFWGVEHFFRKAKGVVRTRVGYIGGSTENPSYKEVCYENTGHAEAIEVRFDPNQTNFEDLCKLFFEIHDPSQVDRQGPDIGEQYRSEIFYFDDAQKQTSERLIKILEDKGISVATKLSKATTFYEAEEYHQNYYEKTGKKPYCHFYIKKF